MSKYIPGLITITITALIINMIYTWHIGGSEFLNFITLYLVNFLAISSSLFQLKLYLDDEKFKKELLRKFQRQSPPSVDELRKEFEEVFGK